MAANPPPDPPTPPADPKPRDPAVVAIGLLVLIALGAFIAYLLRHLGLPQDQWDRAIYLLNAVEAVAFSAAGYIFATQVQRAQIQSLRREVADKTAGEQGGKTLARKVHEKNLQVQSFGRGTEALFSRFPDLDKAEIQRVKTSESIDALGELDTLATQLFPEATRPEGAPR